MNYTIRLIKNNEIEILEEMLYQAAFVPEGQEPFSRDIKNIPEIRAYIKDFGSRLDDICYVALVDNKIIGAVWVRVITGDIIGYGNVDEHTPEFAISLFKEYRNMGIGTELMRTMIEHLRVNGYKKTSLSVNKANYAAKLYEKLGFKIIEEREDDYLMVFEL